MDESIEHKAHAAPVTPRKIFVPICASLHIVFMRRLGCSRQDAIL
jgi:hypothetical protein